jgi:hypothetical protein
MEVLSIGDSKLLYKDVPQGRSIGVEDDEMTMTRGGWVANRGNGWRGDDGLMDRLSLIISMRLAAQPTKKQQVQYWLH